MGRDSVQRRFELKVGGTLGDQVGFAESAPFLGRPFGVTRPVTGSTAVGARNGHGDRTSTRAIQARPTSRARVRMRLIQTADGCLVTTALTPWVGVANTREITETSNSNCPAY